MLYLIFLGISNLTGRAGGDLAGRVMNDKIKLPIGLLIQDSFQKDVFLASWKKATETLQETLVPQGRGETENREESMLQ